MGRSGGTGRLAARAISGLLRTERGRAASASPLLVLDGATGVAGAAEQIAERVDDGPDAADEEPSRAIGVGVDEPRRRGVDEPLGVDDLARHVRQAQELVQEE